jgi:hypothetical protein
MDGQILDCRRCPTRIGAISAVPGCKRYDRSRLLAFAYHSTYAPMEQLTNTITGRYSGETMWNSVI